MQDSEKTTAKQSRPKQRRGGLGRGLESLIPTTPRSAASSPKSEQNAGSAPQRVSIDAIRPNPFQPRLHMEPAQLQELANSITTHGVMQPLVVTSPDEHGIHTLIAGERRWRASTLAGMDTVPIVILDASPQAMLELAIIENVVRADLSPLEEAHAYRRLIEDFSLTQSEVADRVGKSRVAITNTLRLLNAPDQVQQAIVDGSITEGHARAMLGLNSISDQIAMLDIVEARGLSVRQTEQMVRNWDNGPKQKKIERESIDPETVRIESRLREALGTRVTVKRENKGGSVTIQYFSDDQLQAIYDRIIGEELW